MSDPENNLRPQIVVIGVGGGGCNAINNMIRSNLEGCDFIAANTDAQSLASSLARRKIQLGVNASRGLGAGSKPEIGKLAAEEQIQDIEDVLANTDMLLITAGMGGGTGTGAAPVIAKIAKDLNILTVGVVTKPFNYERKQRMRQAEEGIAELQKYVDTLIIIPNQNLFLIANEKTSVTEAFKLADDVLCSGVRGITDLMINPGILNLDFADVKTVISKMGRAMMGTGEVAAADNPDMTGVQRAVMAAEIAISNPLLDNASIKGAKGVLVNITGGPDMPLFDVNAASDRVCEEIDDDALVKIGSTIDESFSNRIRVSVIATGMDMVASSNADTTDSVSNAVSQPIVRTEAPVVSEPAFMTRAPASYSQAGNYVHQEPAGVENVQMSSVRMDASVNYQQPPRQFVMPKAVIPDSVSEDYTGRVAVPKTCAADSSDAMEQTRAPLQRYPEERSTDAGSFRRQKYRFREEDIDRSYDNMQDTDSPDSHVTEITRKPVSSFDNTESDERLSSSPASAIVSQVREARRQQRAESLFSKLTGFGLIRPSSQRTDDDFDDVSVADSDIQSSIVRSNSPRSAISSVKDEDASIEIPAFLRRQSNH